MPEREAALFGRRARPSVFAKEQAFGLKTAVRGTSLLDAKAASVAVKNK